MLAPLCVALAILTATPHSTAHHPGTRARATTLASARAALREVKRDPAKRRYRDQWERAIRALEAAARGKDTAPALLEAARARYALYRFSQVESDRAAALRLATRASRAGAKEAAAFAAAVQREAGEERRAGARAAASPRAPAVTETRPSKPSSPTARPPAASAPVATRAKPRPGPAPAKAAARPPEAAPRTTTATRTSTSSATSTASPSSSPTASPSSSPTPSPSSSPTSPATAAAAAAVTPPAPGDAGDPSHGLEPLEGPDEADEPPSADPVLARILAQLEAEAPAPARPEVRGAAPASVRRVVIDAGHGGHDTGAIGPTGVREKDVTLAIARRVARKLRDAGFEAVLTRDGDRYLALDERTAIANARGGDLFVSIHANAHPRRDRRGVETYVLDVANDRYAKRLAARENGALDEGEAPEVRRILADLDAKASAAPSRRLAAAVQRELTAGIRARYGDVRDLGVKSALFYVLLGARMPAILVETSFLSNRVEERRLASARFQDEVAGGVARAVREFAAREARIAAR